MNSRSHLVPSPTVDRNGKQTTVYRRQESTTTAASFPGPSIPSNVNRRGDDVDAVTNLIRDHLRANRFPQFRDELVDIIRGMSASKDEDYSEVVRETVETIVPAIKRATSMRAMIKVLSQYDEVGVRSMHAHRGYLASNPNMVASFVSLKTDLNEVLGVTPDDDGHMPTIEAHLYAMKQYEQLPLSHPMDGDKAYYRNMTELMQEVEKRPGQVHELIEFISRNPDNVDLSGFDDYLSQGTLREGTL